VRTQTDEIKRALLEGMELTQLDAYRHFGCFRLAARVEELRKQGLDIETQTIKSANGKKFARYRIAHPVQRALPI